LDSLAAIFFSTSESIGGLYGFNDLLKTKFPVLRDNRKAQLFHGDFDSGETEF
jgi:hypothetical protein